MKGIRIVIMNSTIQEVKYITTVVICGDGKVYNLGNGEFPPQPPDEKIRSPKFKVVNAFVCEVEEADRLQAKRKKK